MKIIIRRTFDARPWYLYMMSTPAKGDKEGGTVRAGPFPSGAIVLFPATSLGCVATTLDSLPPTYYAGAHLAHAAGKHYHAQAECGPSESVQVRCHTSSKAVPCGRIPTLDEDVNIDVAEGMVLSELSQQMRAIRTVTAAKASVV